MAKRKRKTLPKDFDTLLKTASLDELKAVFDICALDATGGYNKEVALAFYGCTDELATWLVAAGADIDARDTYQRTPLLRRSTVRDNGLGHLIALGADVHARDYQGDTALHAAAGFQQAASVRMLLRHGADPHASNRQGHTPLHHGLARTGNTGIPGMAEAADALLAAGAEASEAMRAEVERIGRAFEFHRAGFNPDLLAATDAALARLYALFDVTPVGTRRMHDGVSPIHARAARWQDQHQELWELLVPSQGAAATVQGEVIRISGRMSNEILGNGGCNWDRHFKAMLAALPQHLSSGQPLAAAELAELGTLAASLHGGDGDDAQLRRLTELTVRWVGLNPQPIALPRPGYDR